ncbi:hypothetical protein P153DRAFT_297145 [Dothidotthia symphoricarpi CBS 119687]|uniref:Clavaminate synthase-like protein n=1 Tax=Dothidotthia symphoricarpi CBS 119687 TaxID=1392245 RepID=A0A6A6A5L5_9PLEO|nr:uncharacterized protein P153DRAFT_297145 [Dothidotthia symphoricarpi CBS 119687]KAF2126473.1 hypothetical protein P153DRAFT_297145 [Dothidotthia symphoricarpi CBS 119687]
MAVELSPSSKPPEQQFSITTLISRFRTKKIDNKSNSPERERAQRDSRPPLVASPLPLVLPKHQQALPNLGWTSITFPQPSSLPNSNSNTTHFPNASTTEQIPGLHPLQVAYEDLFAASQAFFNQPDSSKQQWKHRLGSEEGWSAIPGEKEFITLRTLEYCPEVLRQPAKKYWDLMGEHLSKTLGRISTSLGLPDDEQAGLRQFVGPCASMQEKEEEKTATMLRLFRYEGWEAKEVAEPHADLGLLSVVVGNVPGLEVWDGNAWFDVEREVERSGRKGASILVGRQLQRFSNGRYPAGGHRVVSYGLPPSGPSPTISPSVLQTEQKRYRFSIVFVLRAHEPLLIQSSTLETNITGTWDEPLEGITVGKMYEQIRGKHFNINIGVEEREKQRQKIRGPQDTCASAG